MSDNFSSGLSADNPEYNQALEYLYSRLPMFSRIGAAAYKPGLETSINLAAAFGNPHNKFKSIHIGGTNGKGSTSHNLASIFQEAGYKTALYTSPHLVDFRERIRINGEMIPQNRVVEFVGNWKNTGYSGSPSFFELTMMMAFQWFASENVDIAIIEVGMGGRLDSTNILTPEMSVITNISKDHTQFLGATLPEIAVEKAGIIKKEIPAVIGEAEGEIREVFEQRAAEVGTQIWFASDYPDLFYDVKELFPSGWEGKSYSGETVETPLGGEYQIANLRTILLAAKILKEKLNYPLSSEVIRRGLKNVVGNTGLMGRWMITGESPLTICDTGHNEAGISHNIAQLRRLMRHRGEGSQLRMVIGFVADKDIDHILTLLPKEAKYYLTNAKIPRALPVNDLAEKCKSFEFDCQSYDDVNEAYRAAIAESSPDDIVFIGGSTFVVADYLCSL